MTWNGAGACLIFSQFRAGELFTDALDHRITFQDFAITSSVSATSSPSLDGRAPPQQDSLSVSWHNRPLRGQVLRERMPGRLLARERTYSRCPADPRHGYFSRELILRRRQLGILKLHLQLIQKPRVTIAVRV
jgi:hypothetical protein